MASEPRCSDCDKDMEKGFVPDLAPGGWDRAHWHPGEAVLKRFLGIPYRANVESSHMIPMDAYRCPSCGLVRLYA